MKTYSILQLHKKKKGNWYGRCRENGQDLWKQSLGTTSKKDAETWLRKQIAESFLPNSQKPVESKNLKQTITSHMNHLESVTSVKNTLDKYLSYLVNFKEWENLPQNLDAFEFLHAQSYVDHLCKSLKPKTVSEYIKVIRVFFSQCIAYNWIIENPFEHKRLKLPKILRNEREFWPDNEIDEILKKVDENTFPFWLTLVKTGLRLDEAMTLTFERVSFSDRVIGVVGKGNKFRKIPICNSLFIVLKELKGKYQKGICFPFMPLTQSGCLKMLKRFLKDSEFNGGQVTIHRFRHSYASNLIRKGYPIAKVSKLLGHASVDETIKTYLHLLPTDCDDVVDYLEPKTPKILSFRAVS